MYAKLFKCNSIGAQSNFALMPVVGATPAALQHQQQ